MHRNIKEKPVYSPLDLLHIFPVPPDWKSGMSVPTDIAIAYLIQGSFYGHSIYATVYMDAWRKDSAVMVVHHIITLALISFSYAFRYSCLFLFRYSLTPQHLPAHFFVTVEQKLEQEQANLTKPRIENAEFQFPFSN